MPEQPGITGSCKSPAWVLGTKPGSSARAVELLTTESYLQSLIDAQTEKETCQNSGP